MTERSRKRRENEKKFGEWETVPLGRRYSLVVKGRHGWKARYVKEVDRDEVTLKFYQEIYDDQGRLIEIHVKYPEDGGHQKAGG